MMWVGLGAGLRITPKGISCRWGGGGRSWGQGAGPRHCGCGFWKGGVACGQPWGGVPCTEACWGAGPQDWGAGPQDWGGNLRTGGWALGFVGVVWGLWAGLRARAGLLARGWGLRSPLGEVPQAEACWGVGPQGSGAGPRAWGWGLRLGGGARGQGACPHRLDPLANSTLMLLPSMWRGGCRACNICSSWEASCGGGGGRTWVSGWEGPPPPARDPRTPLTPPQHGPKHPA